MIKRFRKKKKIVMPPSFYVLGNFDAVIKKMKEAKVMSSDDIVTRLRKELPCWCDAEPTRIEVRDMCWEASAEIERLRKAITDFIIKTSDSHCTWQMENDAIEELKKAVRGE